MRIDFNFNDDQIKYLKSLQRKTGFSRVQEMFNSAMTLLEWSVDEKIKGNEIASIDPASESYRTIAMPILRKAAEYARAEEPQTDRELVLR